MLGDIPRTGPILWHVNRERTEDIKDHVFDLLLMVQILRPYFPSYLQYDKLFNYIICHDLEEAITGDITAFEGVSKSEKNRVNELAMNYLIETYGSVLDLQSYFSDFEEKNNIEAHIAHMLDKVQSVIPFLKYDSEELIQIDNPLVLETLRNHPFVSERKILGKSVSDIFYEFHLMSVVITPEECKKYGISEEDGEKIVNAIKSFMASIYEQTKRLPEIKASFPEDAQFYKRNH